MSTFRQIFGRARLESRDIGILRGVLSSIDAGHEREHETTVCFLNFELSYDMQLNIRIDIPGPWPVYYWQS